MDGEDDTGSQDNIAGGSRPIENLEELVTGSSDETTTVYDAVTIGARSRTDPGYLRPDERTQATMSSQVAARDDEDLQLSINRNSKQMIKSIQAHCKNLGYGAINQLHGFIGELCTRQEKSVAIAMILENKDGTIERTVDFAFRLDATGKLV